MRVCCFLNWEQSLKKTKPISSRTSTNTVYRSQKPFGWTFAPRSSTCPTCLMSSCATHPMVLPILQSDKWTFLLFSLACFPQFPCLVHVFASWSRFIWKMTGHRAGSVKIKKIERTEEEEKVHSEKTGPYHPPTGQATCYEIIDALFQLADRALCPGGRLLYLYPIEKAT